MSYRLFDILGVGWGTKEELDHIIFIPYSILYVHIHLKDNAKTALTS